MNSLLDRYRQRELIPFVTRELTLILFEIFSSAKGSCVYINPRALTRRICERLRVSDKKVAPIVSSIFKLLTKAGVVEEYRMGSKEDVENPKRVVYRIDRASELWQLIMSIKTGKKADEIAREIEEKYLKKMEIE